METKKNTTPHSGATSSNGTHNSRNASESTREKLSDHARNEKRDSDGRFESGTNNRNSGMGGHNDYNSRTHRDSDRHSDSMQSDRGDRRNDNDIDEWIIIESNSCEF